MTWAISRPQACSAPGCPPPGSRVLVGRRRCRAASAHGCPSAPLLISADPLLVADVQRLSAAAGVAARGGARPGPGAALVERGARSSSSARTAPASSRRRAHHDALACSCSGRSPVGDALFRDALGVGAETVAGLPESETWLVELLTDVGDGGAAPGVTIGVLGGAGGAGATVFAAALAQVAADVGPTLLVDADPIGAGIDRVLGLESADGIRWDSMLQTTGRLSSRSLREALPRTGMLSVLTWPPDRPASLQAFAMREVLSAGSARLRRRGGRPAAAPRRRGGGDDHPLRPRRAGLHADGARGDVGGPGREPAAGVHARSDTWSRGGAGPGSRPSR